MNRLIDQEIAHISRIMWPSLLVAGGAILSSEYWRMRLNALLDAPSLTKVQLCALDSLLLRLDHYDRHGVERYVTPSLEVAVDNLTAHDAEPVALHG